MHYVKRITARKRRDVDMLKARLDVYSDEWRTAQPDPLTKAKLPTNLTPTGKIRKPRLKKNSMPATPRSTTPEAERKPTPIIEGKLGRKKKTKLEKVCKTLVYMIKNTKIQFLFISGERSECTKTTCQSIFSILSRTKVNIDGRIE